MSFEWSAFALLGLAFAYLPPRPVTAAMLPSRNINTPPDIDGVKSMVEVGNSADREPITVYLAVRSACRRMRTHSRPLYPSSPALAESLIIFSPGTTMSTTGSTSLFPEYSMTNLQQILEITSLKQKVQPKIYAANYNVKASL
ncbi:hypothetical protein PILCRDRAFT_13240 [Piloderma croceum F 1598]|uniref:Uncharacterized protein n=1 Tax=Piloderma croceum (strain F 1598) TaxID=765440 RepID=A0A0C3F7L7_PILCF|nr:hypothetical protein PILCRDRAFT_13240 [Piloderma croceum F 1598]